jgi:hypothetical protein
MVKRRAGNKGKRLSVEHSYRGSGRVVFAGALLAYVLIFAIVALFPSVFGGVSASGIYVSVIGVLMLSVPLFVLAGVTLAIMTLLNGVRGTEKILAVLQVASVAVGLLGVLVIVATSDPDTRESSYAVVGAMFLALGISSGLTGVLAGATVWNGRLGVQARK